MYDQLHRILINNLRGWKDTKFGDIHCKPPNKKHKPSYSQAFQQTHERHT